MEPQNLFEHHRLIWTVTSINEKSWEDVRKAPDKRYSMSPEAYGKGTQTFPKGCIMIDTSFAGHQGKFFEHRNFELRNTSVQVMI